MLDFEKIHEQDEVIDDGLGLLVRNKTLYHGSGKKGIEQLNNAEEDTIGAGVYFTSEPSSAQGYAERRARRNEGDEPVVYEALIENMRFLDLRKDENVKSILPGLKDVLAGRLKTPDLKWTEESVLQQNIEKIDSGKIGSGNIREVTFSVGELFTDYVRSLGYEGLIAIEGGEGQDIGNHDTFLVFDPEKAKIVAERNI